MRYSVYAVIEYPGGAKKLKPLGHVNADTRDIAKIRAVSNWPRYEKPDQTGGGYHVVPRRRDHFVLGDAA